MHQYYDLDLKRRTYCLTRVPEVTAMAKGQLLPLVAAIPRGQLHPAVKKETLKGLADVMGQSDGQVKNLDDKLTVSLTAFAFVMAQSDNQVYILDNKLAVIFFATAFVMARSVDKDNKDTFYCIYCSKPNNLVCFTSTDDLKAHTCVNKKTWQCFCSCGNKFANSSIKREHKLGCDGSGCHKFYGVRGYPGSQYRRTKDYEVLWVTDWEK